MARRRRRVASFAIYSRFAHFAEFPAYVSAGSRRAKAEHQRATLAKAGRAMSPVRIEGRAITSTFWGDAWCDNLERYSDFANRLPRGRSYVRNGLVLDLQLEAGRAVALVSGTTLYDVSITVAPLAPPRWKALCASCAGAIDSLVELLQGRLSNAVMTRLCDARTGLFPAPNEITFACSCPDGAWMCKHVAAVLYGIGARLDTQPALLFTLRQVDQQDLVAHAGADLSAARPQVADDRVLVTDDLSELFEIDVAAGSPPELRPGGIPARSRASKSPRQRPGAKTSKRGAATDVAAPKPRTSEKAAVKRAAPSIESKRQSTRPPSKRAKSSSDAKRRESLSKRMKQYWAARRKAAAVGRKSKGK